MQEIKGNKLTLSELLLSCFGGDSLTLEPLVSDDQHLPAGGLACGVFTRDFLVDRDLLPRSQPCLRPALPSGNFIFSLAKLCHFSSFSSFLFFLAVDFFFCKCKCVSCNNYAFWLINHQRLQLQDYHYLDSNLTTKW